MSTIYVAVPIDQAGATTHQALSQVDLAGWLNLAGHVGYWPSRAFTVGNTLPTTGIEAVNRAALEMCDGLIAVLPAGVPTVGVPREIEAALALGIPVAVLTDLTHSWSLADVDRYPLTPEGAEKAVLAVGTGERASSVVKVVLGPDARLPTRAHETDAGFDLYVSEDTVIEPGEFVDIDTGLRLAFPPGLWGRITGRSSTLRKKGLMVAEGVIDGGYRGPIFAGVWNLGTEPVEVQAGERLAQIIPHFNVAMSAPIVEVDEAEFDATPHDGRGDAGFGSSGR